MCICICISNLPSTNLPGTLLHLCSIYVCSWLEVHRFYGDPNEMFKMERSYLLGLGKIVYVHLIRFCSFFELIKCFLLFLRNDGALFTLKDLVVALSEVLF